jgi:MFS family permease
MARALTKSPFFVLLCAVGIVFLAYGSRQSFGVYLPPITKDLGWEVSAFSGALAIQALVYGLSAPFVGAVADKWGAVRVIVVAGLLYSAGIFLMSQSVTPTGMRLSAGLFGGVGSAGCALSLVLAVASRVAPDNRRGLWLGIITSAGTGGQLVIVPLSQFMISGHGWVFAMMALGFGVLLILPLGLMMGRAAGDMLTSKKDSLGLVDALKEARAHPGFWLLSLGFFTCGFQVQYINNHLPNFLNDVGLAPMVAASAISVIGLFNMIGTWISGWLADRYRKKYLLASLYLCRSLVFVVFISVPVTPLSVYVFAVCIGLLWLATVPLTSGIVFGMFGPRYMATLYGIVFFFHQVGSFTSVWLGGIIRDINGSYDVAWWIIIIGGTLASFLHWPIDDRPVDEVLADRKAAV